MTAGDGAEEGHQARDEENEVHPVDHGECGFRISLCAHVQPSMQDQWLRDEQTTP
jgi:hypothetical protein